MFIIKRISDVFNKFLNKPDATPSDKKSSKDDCSTPGSELFPPGDDRQSSKEEEQRAKSTRETREVYQSLSPYREENIQAHQVSSEPAPQSQRAPTHSSLDTGTQTSRALSSEKGLAQPKESSTTPTPGLAPQLAYYALRCGCTVLAVVGSSGRSGAELLSATGSKITPQAVVQYCLKHKQLLQVMQSRKGSAQPLPESSASAPQVKPQLAGLGHTGRIQPRHGESSVTLDTANKQQTQLRISVPTTETSLGRQSSLQTNRRKPSAIEASSIRSSSRELLPEKNRIPWLQLQALNKHINSYYVKDLRSCSQDCLDVEAEFFEGRLSSYRFSPVFRDTMDLLVRNACLPYRPDLVNTWFREFVTRVPTAEPKGKPLGAHVDMINLIKTNDFKKMLEAVAKFRTIHLEDGEEIYFHATDVQSALCIIEEGIDLTKTRSREDFSNGYGFYVTPDYTKSAEWANRKVDRFCHNTGAIIAFKVSRQLQKELPHLCLEVSTAEGRRNWENTISHFRNGEAFAYLSVLLGNVKFIRGPVCRFGILRPGEIPEPGDFTQICICDKEYAKRYGSLSNICFIIFFKVN